ncbi:hypothetical protein [Pimelobacter simplex]|uniref:hypothetical protein n=1 Tax=Nocardioides simplex TaxID=2045 RepID=UPI00193494A5|nr:hypothetical protein [Pimelobacter simplex]
MNTPPQKAPHQDAAHQERPVRPDRWLLDLGLEVEAGRRPWLRTLAGAPLMLGPVLVARLMTDFESRDVEPDPTIAPIVDRLTSLLTVVGFVGAAVFLVAGLAHWFACRRAYRVWRSLPEAERDALRRERVEQLRRMIVALGGEAPDELTIRPEDLEDLSDRHRRLLEDLRACSRQAAESICAGARARTGDLVMAGRLHRALSKDTIVRPPHAAGSATDPRVVALVELDEAIQAEAAAIRESLATGHCNCDQETNERLVRAGDRAHARLHGLDPDDPKAQSSSAPRPHWVGRLIWAGVAVTIAALPIGLLTPIPSVTISALGLTVTGAGFLAENHRAGAAATAPDQLRRRLFVITWLVVVAAAAAVLLA